MIEQDKSNPGRGLQIAQIVGAVCLAVAFLLMITVWKPKDAISIGLYVLVGAILVAFEVRSLGDYMRKFRESQSDSSAKGA